MEKLGYRESFVFIGGNVKGKMMMPNEKRSESSEVSIS